MAKLQTDWDTTALTAFMLELVRNGTLVEASELWAYWGDTAQLPLVTATAMPAEGLAKLPKIAQERLLPGKGDWNRDVALRSGGLAETLVQRESSRTFDDIPLSMECLCSVLWATHGVTRPSNDDAVVLHRTIASAGNMHSTRWYVVTLRDLGSENSPNTSFPAGVYEARFHVRGGVSLHKLDAKKSDAYRCLRDPRVLRFASALIIPVCEISVPGAKYGNRASLFAMIEAGQALQNAQLMATELGASCILRGDTIARASLDMLGLRNGLLHWFVVTAMVLGARASRSQAKQQQAESFLRIHPNLCLFDESFAFAAMPASPQTNALYTGSGRSHDPKLAITKAEAEGWERFAWLTPRDLDAGRFSDVPGAVLPGEMVSYSARQYAQKNFACVPFSRRRQYLWAKAINTESGDECRVLADCVYAHSSLPERFKKSAYTSASTSGIAAGISLADALSRATLELIERDAFICAWISRRAPQSIETASLPDSAARRIADLTLLGFRVVVSDLTREWAPVISIFAQSDQMPLTAITAAAHFSAEQALEKALDEMEGRIAHAQKFKPLGSSPMEQIEKYYRSPVTYKRSDFYVAGAEVVAFSSVENSVCRDWNQLQSLIIQSGFDLLAINMTPENASVEQGRVPLHVVRAIVPGLIPIWFQAGTQPEGMSRFSKISGDVVGVRASRFFKHPFT